MATVSVDLAVEHLTGFDEYLVLLRGFELGTDVPQKEDFPDNGYDPAHGYTTRGHGAGVSEPVVTDGLLEFSARLRVEWGPSDRADMNEALAHATVEGTVHCLILGITVALAEEFETGEHGFSIPFWGVQ